MQNTHWCGVICDINKLVTRCGTLCGVFCVKWIQKTKDDTGPEFDPCYLISLKGGTKVVPTPCKSFIHAVVSGFDSRRLHHYKIETTPMSVVSILSLLSSLAVQRRTTKGNLPDHRKSAGMSIAAHDLLML